MGGTCSSLRHVAATEPGRGPKQGGGKEEAPVATLLPPVLPEVPETALGAAADYVIEELVGTGSFGEVRKGRSKADGTLVAIKTLRREAIKPTSLAREFTVLTRVQKFAAGEAIVQYLGAYKTAETGKWCLWWRCERSLTRCFLASRKRCDLPASPRSLPLYATFSSSLFPFPSLQCS